MFGHFHWLEGSLPAAHPETCWVLHRESGPSSSSCKTTSSGGRVSVDRDSSSCLSQQACIGGCLGRSGPAPRPWGSSTVLTRRTCPTHLPLPQLNPQIIPPPRAFTYFPKADKGCILSAHHAAHGGRYSPGRTQPPRFAQVLAKPSLSPSGGKTERLGGPKSWQLKQRTCWSWGHPPPSRAPVSGARVQH